MVTTPEEREAGKAELQSRIDRLQIDLEEAQRAVGEARRSDRGSISRLKSRRSILQKELTTTRRGYVLVAQGERLADVRRLLGIRAQEAVQEARVKRATQEQKKTDAQQRAVDIRTAGVKIHRGVLPSPGQKEPLIYSGTGLSRTEALRKDLYEDAGIIKREKEPTEFYTYERTKKPETIKEVLPPIYAKSSSPPSNWKKNWERITTPVVSKIAEVKETTPYKKFLDLQQQASTKLYKITGFSEGQHQKQVQDVFQTTEFLKGRVSESTEWLKGIGADIKLPVFVPSVFTPGGIKPFEIKVSPVGIGHKTAMFGVELGEGISGFVGGTAKKTLDKPISYPLKYVALGGAGYVGGLGVGGVGSLGGYLGGQTGAAISKAVLTTAALGVGGYFTYKTGKDILKTETSYEKGLKIGETVLNVAAISGGIASGQKAWLKIEGRLASRNRELLSPEQLTRPEVLEGKKTFPTAPKGKQLKIFKEGKYRLPGEPAGAYHTTPYKFWKKGDLPLGVGKAELPGLYGSSEVSVYFSGVKGGGKYTLLPSIKSLIQPGGKPGIAYIVPKDFRIASWARIPGTASKPLGYRWTTPSLKGVADIPLLKTELEAVFRPGTGSYTFTSGKYATIIEGVKVPIDVFKYAGGSSTALSTPPFLKGGAYSYTLPPVSSPIISPYAAIPLSIPSTSKVTSSSYMPTVSYTPSSKPSSYKSSYKSPTSSSYMPSSSVYSVSSYISPTSSSLKTSKVSTPSSYKSSYKPPTSTTYYPYHFRSPPSPPPIIFPWPGLGKRKKKKKELRGMKDIVLSEGFTAKQLGLKPIKIKLKDISKYAGEPIKLRRAPIIVREKRKRRKK